MASSGTLSTQQGVAYIIAAHGVLQQQARRNKCPVALLHTLLALESMNSSATSCLNARTSELQRVMQLSLPLLRGYIRELVARQYVEHERVFRRGPRLLKLTPAGRQLVRDCQRALRNSAALVLEWPLLLD